MNNLTQILARTTSSRPFPSSFSSGCLLGSSTSLLCISNLLFQKWPGHLRLPRQRIRLRSHRSHHIQPIHEATILSLMAAFSISWLVSFRSTAVELASLAVFHDRNQRFFKNVNRLSAPWFSKMRISSCAGLGYDTILCTAIVARALFVPRTAGVTMSSHVGIWRHRIYAPLRHCCPILRSRWLCLFTLAVAVVVYHYVISQSLPGRRTYRLR